MALSSTIASFKFNGDTIPAIGSCSISAARPDLDITPIGSFNSYSDPGILTSVISLDLYYAGASHAALVTQLLAPTDFTSFEITFAGTPTDKITGYCLVVGFDGGVASGEITRASVTLKVSGPIIYTQDATIVESTWGGGEVDPSP